MTTTTDSTAYMLAALPLLIAVIGATIFGILVYSMFKGAVDGSGRVRNNLRTGEEAKFYFPFDDGSIRKGWVKRIQENALRFCTDSCEGLTLFINYIDEMGTPQGYQQCLAYLADDYPMDVKIPVLDRPVEFRLRNSNGAEVYLLRIG